MHTTVNGCVSQSQHDLDWGGGGSIVLTFLFNSERALDGEQGSGNDQSLVSGSLQHNTALRSVVWVSRVSEYRESSGRMVMGCGCVYRMVTLLAVMVRVELKPYLISSE
jgi:hypothetical protein